MSGHETPAFPTQRIDGIVEDGLNIRDYFAAHAPEPPKEWHGGARETSDLIDWRWYYADAMLKARAA